MSNNNNIKWDLSESFSTCPWSWLEFCRESPQILWQGVRDELIAEAIIRCRAALLAGVPREEVYLLALRTVAMIAKVLEGTDRRCPGQLKEADLVSVIRPLWNAAMYSALSLESIDNANPDETVVSPVPLPEGLHSTKKFIVSLACLEVRNELITLLIPLGYHRVGGLSIVHDENTNSGDGAKEA